MSTQHLSDEAVAAAADGVLTGHARDRATRHLAECDECAHAVRVQREAAWALRTAPAPALPSEFLDRLRTVVEQRELPLPAPWPDEQSGTYLPIAAPIAAIAPQSGRPERDDAGEHRRRSLFPTGLFRSGDR
ncbi:hypothetical protein [Jatrophihabitans endophyticus]|uniref:hypothetical protein n=1 Tax=Jatrophihabitans endophyticus TaxID=1206085 RepID=UPI0019F4EAB2|nr:hypothetical protein [Jatrophihabitans endophyticus]MBE7188532.1 hypothetical protein [Jatrophihabitans endophyticus]